jgi:hypothetical protein
MMIVEGRFLILTCIDHLDKSFRRLKGTSRTPIIGYHKFCANNGVNSMAVTSKQAEFLDALTMNARLFYLAFAFVDGTDGIANGIGRLILEYVGAWEEEEEDGDEQRELSILS